MFTYLNHRLKELLTMDNLNQQELIEIEEELDTIVADVSWRNSISSVLDELEDFCDSHVDTPTKSKSDFSQEDKKFRSLQYEVKDVEDMSCDLCVFKTNSENILKLHKKNLHGFDFDVASNPHNFDIEVVARKRNFVKRNTKNIEISRHCFCVTSKLTVSKIL